MASTRSANAWVAKAERLLKAFAARHGITIGPSERQLSAAFEVGCLHSLLRFYKKEGYAITPINLIHNEYRYLTTPSGNPANFSFVSLHGRDGRFEVRQQVRIQSHVADDVQFTPDIVVLVKDAKINAAKDSDFAGGRRKLFSVRSDQVVAAHECKSLNPFPELMVGFIGMLVTAHSWYPNGRAVTPASKGHLAPSLFVGGSARALHLRMIAALQSSYRLNVVVGLHAGTWDLGKAKNRLKWTGASGRDADVNVDSSRNTT